LRIDDTFPATRITDRYNGAFPMGKGWNHVRIPLAEIQRSANQRPLDLKAVRRIIFFVEMPKALRVFYLDWVRLE
jgi:hypothetical protein